MEETRLPTPNSSTRPGPRGLRRVLVLGGAALLGLLVVSGIYLVNGNDPDAGIETALITGLLAVQVGLVVRAWSRSRTFRFLTAAIPIPLGAGAWFAGMAFGFDGGGPWTGWIAQAGLCMIAGGWLLTIVVLCIPPK